MDEEEDSTTVTGGKVSKNIINKDPLETTISIKKPSNANTISTNVSPNANVNYGPKLIETK